MDATHYRPPQGFDATFNRLARWLVDHGVNLAGAQTLTVTGRRSGRPQRVPVNPLRVDGTEYLVSPRGNSQWVRNVRVEPTAELRRGRRSRGVRLVEVDVAERPAVIAPYLKAWGWEVKRFLPEGMTVDAGPDDLARFAPQIPVFRIE
ncbi:nitroreductase/quinone reductase family protein [Gordonia sp. NPDC003376]